MSSLIVLSGSEVDAVLKQPGAIQAAVASQRQLFIDFHRSQHEDPSSIQLPHRLTVSSSQHKVLFMPSRYGHEQTTGCKIVSVPTRPDDQGGLAGTTIVLDEETGVVKGMVNARKLTAVRNACGSYLFCSMFARSSLTKLVIFGSGEQARQHALIFSAMYSSIDSIVIAARAETKRLRSLVDELSATVEHARFSFVTSEYESAVQDADIIVTCTPSTEPLFDSSVVRDGTALCLIGSYQPHMHEVDQALVARAGKIVVDSKSACLKEAGELIKAGKREQDLVELGEILSGLRADEEAQVRIYKSVGIGIQDIAIAKTVLGLAAKSALGTTIPNYD